ncbi:DNA gyrase inhibitor YacG [Sandarakinorhabdus rubra]|uniref:DNA gyrase inhibitor YacG n=1 Tax=Sandarakinorhabdus rubra TaxID=2672568 RepID=UPI0013D9D755|nr:DNA gyrase inhibitor YacG [Sandarakinorhabdus rubra]
MSSPVDPASPARACAYCRRQPAVAAYRPFCSAGCRARDLNAWLSDAYAVPARSDEDELLPPSPLDNDDEAG